MVLFGENSEELAYISLQIANCKMSILSYFNAYNFSFTLYWLVVFPSVHLDEKKIETEQIIYS